MPTDETDKPVLARWTSWAAIAFCALVIVLASLQLG
jgi:preprotein translocase subunit SecG